MISQRFAIAILALSTCLAAPLRADQISEQLESARAAYERGELQTSVQGLQFVIAAIQERIDQALLKLLPEPLPGWTAEESQASSGGMASMIVGTNLSRQYHREDGASLEINLTANSPFLPMMTLLLSNPFMVQSDPNNRLYTHAGRRGLIHQDRDAKGWEISLMGNGNLLIRVSGTGIEKADAESYLQAIDLAAVEKALSTSTSR
ncbi:MAG: hypothetical protein WAT23_11855 [Chromatiaceae bacterium]